MINHDVRVHPEKDRLPKEEQLAWKIAQVVSDPVEMEQALADRIVNRVIDNASVAIAAINRPVTLARAPELAYPHQNSAAVGA